MLKKRLAGPQTRYANKQERRTQSLWEGRDKMSIVESDSYILQCCRYIELNPVKAKMVAQPEHRPASQRAKDHQLNKSVPALVLKNMPYSLMLLIKPLRVKTV